MFFFIGIKSMELTQDFDKLSSNCINLQSQYGAVCDEVAKNKTITDVKLRSLLKEITGKDVRGYDIEAMWKDHIPDNQKIILEFEAILDAAWDIYYLILECTHFKKRLPINLM